MYRFILNITQILMFLNPKIRVNPTQPEKKNPRFWVSRVGFGWVQPNPNLWVKDLMNENLCYITDLEVSRRANSNRLGISVLF
jgi:hypothetical protein